MIQSMMSIFEHGKTREDLEKNQFIYRIAALYFWGTVLVATVTVAVLTVGACL